MSENRRYQRFSINSSDINCNILFATDVNILNISVTGVALKADRRLEIGREYLLKLLYKDKAVSLTGTVMWSIITGSKKNENGEFVPLYTAGLKFNNMISEKMAALIDFIDSHKIGADKRVIGIRFNVKSPDKASINYPERCKVKKISLGGMLIEAEERFEIESRFYVDLLLEDKIVGCLVRVASCLEISDNDTNAYDVGLEFLDMSDEDRTKLVNLINSLDTETYN